MASSVLRAACAAPTALPAGPGRGRARARLGWRGPVLLLEGCFEPRDLELCSRLDLWHVVHCAEQIDWLAAHKTQQPHRVFLKMNSGMNRLGFTPAPSAAPGRA
jgi:alanine racemase